MNITFYGAVREVTGSMHLLSTEHDRILLDCGMFHRRVGPKLGIPDDLRGSVLKSEAVLDLSGDNIIGFSGKYFPLPLCPGICGIVYQQKRLQNDK